MKKLYNLLFIISLLSFQFLNIKGQSFEIVDPGPQPAGVEFYLQLINARDDIGELRNGDFQVQILTIEPQSPSTESLYSGGANFSEGIALVPIEIPWAGLWYARVRIAGHLESQQYIYLSTDLSGFTIQSPGTQTAGIPFPVSITAGKDFDNTDLNGDHLVTITTSNTLEGSGGQLFSGNVSFSAGDAVISDPAIVLSIAQAQTLTVIVEGVTEPEVTDVFVEPAPASKLVITTQPGNVTGNFDDNPVTLNPIIIETRDVYDNPSISGLGTAQYVNIGIENNPGGANLDGTTTLDIQSGTATFSDITLNEEGIGYTMSFTSENPVLLNLVVSDPFTVSQLYDLSGFTIDSPLPSTTQFQSVDFQVQISGLQDKFGATISGEQNVIVTSSLEGVVFNNIVGFTGGEAELTLALDNLGDHNLIVSIEDVTNDQVIGLTVDPDLSGFLVADPGSPQYADFPFSIGISDAKDMAGNALSGDAMVTITSSADGTVYNETASFSVGEVTVSVSLATIGIHALTVNIAGITADMTISDISVEANSTNFNIDANSTSEQEAGLNSSIYIIDASSITGELNSSNIVTITSNITDEGNGGVVFDGGVNFTSGDSEEIIINLEIAGLHSLTISVDGITPVKTHEIAVNAATASQLVIIEQSLGGEGLNDDTATAIGTVIVQTQDDFGNLSVNGLDSEYNIIVDIGNNPGGADLTGNKSHDVSITGEATFDDLKINKDGEGYTLSFSSTGFTSVTSDGFNMTNVEDQSGFDIVPPGPQVVNLEFNLRLINTRDAQGNPFNSEENVNIVQNTPTPEKVVFNGEVQFVNGEANIPLTLSEPVEYEFTVILALTLAKSFTTVVSEDGSGFDLAAVSSPQTAGTPFDLIISNARDARGTDYPLVGSHLVTVTSNNNGEGDNGVLLNSYLDFEGGAPVENPAITLTIADDQVLAVSIDWVKNPVNTGSITVDPGAATQFLIIQQPEANLTGNNDDTPLGLGTVILQIQDNWGNVSTSGLGGTMTVSAAITDDPAGVTLGGADSPVDISNGEATFNNLSINKNGDYTLSFAYNGTAPAEFGPDPVISSTISITDLEDLSGFNVVAEDVAKYENIPFGLYISNGKDIAGELLDGESINVTVERNGDVEVYNEGAAFVAGAVTLGISLPAGIHDLIVVVGGVTGSMEITGLVVSEDQSGFTLGTNPSGGPFYHNNPFELFITGATDLDGTALSGDVNVTIISDKPEDGEVLNGALNFNSGVAEIELILETVGTHILTVDVESITDSKIIEIIVGDNISGFVVQLDEDEDKTAGTLFNLGISDAVSLSGTELDDDEYEYHVTVISDVVEEGTDGVVYNQGLIFTTGSASIGIDLKIAGTHNLTVSIDSITPVKVVEVNVVAAEASQLVITQQPSG